MVLWEAVLKIKEQLWDVSTLPASIAIQYGETLNIGFDQHIQGAHLILHLKREDEWDTNCLCENFRHVEVLDEKHIGEKDLELLKLYLPYAFAGYFGRKMNKCYSVSHFAQTLDGRIASCHGDSKWIGNEANLQHAHRMRALCDAILVGTKTVQRDNPRLNVRKVSGPHPVKIIIGNRELPANKYKAIEPSTLIFGDQRIHNGEFTNVFLEKDPEYDLVSLLNKLADRGIHSVYIEGGSFTTSHFLQQKALDQIQLHFSSKILGSGINSFGFEGIESIENAITFKSTRFIPMGDEMMFIGELQK